MTKSTFVLKNKPIEWILALCFYAAVFVFFIVYHDWRGKPISIFTANKCIAIASCTCISISLFLGSLARLFRLPVLLLRYRRPLGITAGYALFFHVFLSIFVLNNVSAVHFKEWKMSTFFNVSYYSKNWISTLFGLSSFAILLLLIFFSNPTAFKKIGFSAWKRVQRLSIVAIILCLFHFVMLDKLPNWSNWIKTIGSDHATLPPGTMIPFAIAISVLVFRVIDSLKLSNKRGPAPSEIDVEGGNNV